MRFFFHGHPLTSSFFSSSLTCWSWLLARTFIDLTRLDFACIWTMYWMPCMTGWDPWWIKLFPPTRVPLSRSHKSHRCGCGLKLLTLDNPHLPLGFLMLIFVEHFIRLKTPIMAMVLDLAYWTSPCLILIAWWGGEKEEIMFKKWN
jgi:hypothetical protein